jgi:integrase/recombinase XerD
MESFLIGNVNGRLILDTRRAKTVNGVNYYPIKVRLTLDRAQYYVSLGFDLTDETFNRLYGVNEKTNKPYRLSGDEPELKNLIAASFNRIEETVKEIHQVEEYNHDKLRNKLRKGRKTYIDVAFDNKITELKKNGQAGTAASYETAKKFILRYKTDIRFIDINSEWLKKFEVWALNKEGINETSLSIYLRALRSLFNDAIKSVDVPRGAYPFDSKDSKGYIIPKGTGTKIALTLEQMNRIATMELTGSPERCRDMFLLSFHLGGINFKDMLLLKWKNIKGGEVHFIREKTKNTNRSPKSISVPFTDKARHIIEKWGNPDKSPEAYVIPHLTDGLTPEKLRDSVKSFTKQVNKQLKEIGTQQNIDGLSSMVARHSFATILKNSGAPVAFIGETLGHSSTKTTENYLKSFETEQKKEHFKVISNIGG